MIDIEVKHRMLQFTKEELQQILAQYNRTIDNVQIDVDCIKKWFDSQPHLTQTPDDRLILSMLMKCKFSIEKTKTNLDYYYSVRSIIPELFQNRLPTDPDIIEVRKIWRTFTIPTLMNLNRVLFFVADEMDHNFNPYTLIAKSFLDGDAITYRDLANSYELILDFTNINFAFCTQFTLTMLKMCLTLSKNLYSHRCKTIRIIGVPSFAEIIINAFISCLPQKLKMRISIHNDRCDLSKYYPKEQLPVEYGGSGVSFHEMSKHFDDMVEKCTDYFQNIQNFMVNEELRPAKLDNDKMFGCYGNFRNLDVD